MQLIKTIPGVALIIVNVALAGAWFILLGIGLSARDAPASVFDKIISFLPLLIMPLLIVFFLVGQTRKIVAHLFWIFGIFVPLLSWGSFFPIFMINILHPLIAIISLLGIGLGLFLSMKTHIFIPFYMLVLLFLSNYVIFGISPFLYDTFPGLPVGSLGIFFAGILFGFMIGRITLLLIPEKVQNKISE